MHGRSPEGAPISSPACQEHGVRRPALLALCLFVLSAAGVGWATPAAADTTLEAKGGAASGFLPGHHVPIVVTVHADRLIRGVVRVAANDSGGRFGADPSAPGSGVVEIPVEVAGGSTKDFVAVVPGTAPQRGQPQADFSATIVLREGDTELGRQSVNLQARDWEETIGVLPNLAAAGAVPRTAPLRFNSGTANLVAITPLVLDAGAQALGPFSAIVGSESDLDAMAPASRRAVLEWVAEGGHLLIDTDSGPIAGLPASWQPGTGGWSIAGAGDVRLTRGEATAGHWANLFDPTANGSISQTPPIEVLSNFDGSQSVASSLGADAGFRLPALGVLMGVLVVYVVLAGPVTFVVLARLQKRQLAWVVVPALAAFFTVAFAIGGSAVRSDTDVAHGTIIDIGPTGARASSATLVGSVNGGRAQVDMPSGWVADNAVANPFGPFGQFGSMMTTASPFMTTASGVSATMTLDPGEFTLVRATGPVEGYDTALEVHATTDGVAVHGTVRNNLSVELTEVTVLVHQTATSIGTIGPGAQKDFTVATPLQTGNGGAPELAQWPISPADSASNGDMTRVAIACAPGPNGCRASPDRRSDASTDVNSATWLDFATAQQTSLRALGAVSVVGWTDRLPSPLTLDGGRPIERGRTAIVSHANIDVRTLDTIGARIEEVRDTDLRKDDTEERDLQVNGKLYRILLPATVDGRPLDPASVTIRPPTGFHQIAVPGATEWTNVPVQDDRIEYRVKPSDVVAGVLYVRTRIGDQFAQSPEVEFSAPLKGWQIVAGDGAGDKAASIDLTNDPNNTNNPNNPIGGPVPLPAPAPTFPPLPGGANPVDAAESGPPTSLEVPPTRSTTPPGTIAPPGPVNGGGS